MAAAAASTKQPLSSPNDTTTVHVDGANQNDLDPPEPMIPAVGVVAPVLDVAALDAFFLHVLVSKTRAILQPLLGSSSEDDHQDTIPLLDWCKVLNRMGLVPLLLHFGYEWTTQGQTPAAQALGLRLVDTRRTTHHSSPLSNTLQQQQQQPQVFSRQRFLSYLVLTSLAPILYEQFQEWIVHCQQAQRRREQEQRHDDNDEQEEVSGQLLPTEFQNLQQQQQVARKRQLQTALAIQQGFNLLVPLARLLLVLHCWNTTTTTPTTTNVLQWIFGFAYQSSNPDNNYNYNHKTNASFRGQRLQVSFAHRRFLWQELERTGRLWILDGLGHVAQWLFAPSSSPPLKTPLLDQSSSLVNTNKNGSSLAACPFCHVALQDIIIPMKITATQQVCCYTCLYQALWQQQQQQREGDNHPHGRAKSTALALGPQGEIQGATRVVVTVS